MINNEMTRPKNDKMFKIHSTRKTVSSITAGIKFMISNKVFLLFLVYLVRQYCSAWLVRYHETFPFLFGCPQVVFD
jgi:hypothetical protein